MGRLILVLGGARSGKSGFARAYAKKLSGGDGARVLFIATATAGDDEMRARIEKHKLDRPAGWTTLEVPKQVGEAIAKHASEYAVVLVDCLTLLINNYLAAEEEQSGSELTRGEIVMEIEAVLEAVGASDANVIIVSNEVGMGLVPVYRMGRDFRDLTGMAHQKIAAAAEEVYLLVAGIPHRIKPTNDESPI
jgi:adenosylcobinamide kinase/adenosylcobinamide-phosphate guanylyltransferase